METSDRFDAHCHIFTMEYALKEVRSLLHDILIGTYPWHGPSESLLMNTRINWHDLKELIRQLYETIHAVGSTEEENLLFLQSQAKKVFPTDNLRIIPLMMDVFYMYAYPLYKNQDIQKVNALKSAEVDRAFFQESWNIILDDFRDYIQSSQAAIKASVRPLNNRNLDQLLQLIEKERIVENSPQLTYSAKDLSGVNGFYETEGFCFHMNQLMDLSENRKGQLYPFIAIDPRRPGMIEALLSGRFFEGERRFYGVKLYPRMGYHPQSLPMDAVYKYCSDTSIPIIFHCGKGGFPPGEPSKWPYSDFGNPKNFEAVVKKYPDLRIDFAHMGSSEPTFEWMKTIVRLINENENVYSDLSCYTNTESLFHVKEYWDENPKLKTRLMFGTDYDVMYFTGLVTMETYYNNFKSVFKEDLGLLMNDNPKRFMQLDF